MNELNSGTRKVVAFLAIGWAGYLFAFLLKALEMLP